MMAKKVEKFEKASLRSKKEIKNLEDKVNSLQLDLEDTRSQLQVSQRVQEVNMSQANEFNDLEECEDSEYVAQQNNQHHFVNEGQGAELQDQVNDLAALEGEDGDFKQPENDYIVAEDHRRPSRLID